MFTTISLLTPFAAWVKVSSMMYCTGNRRQSTTHVWWGLKQTGILPNIKLCLNVSG